MVINLWFYFYIYCCKNIGLSPIRSALGSSFNWQKTGRPLPHKQMRSQVSQTGGSWFSTLARPHCSRDTRVFISKNFSGRTGEALHLQNEAVLAGNTWKGASGAGPARAGVSVLTMGSKVRGSAPACTCPARAGRMEEG